MKNKFNLDNLNVQSFVTDSVKAKGGNGTLGLVCQEVSLPPAQCQTNEHHLCGGGC